MRLSFIFIVVFLLISCGTSAKTKKEDKALRLEERFQLAFKAAERGNLEEAVNEYQQVLKLDPQHSKANLNLGLAFGRQGRGEKEISQYKKAIGIDPNF